MVDPVQPEPGEDELRGRNVLDATYTCTDILSDEGGQAICWYATDNEHRGVAVKVFKNYPGGAAFNDEVQIYEFLGAHANLVRMLHNNPNGLQVFEEPNYQRNRAYIVLEEIPGGSFFQYVSRV